MNDFVSPATSACGTQTTFLTPSQPAPETYPSESVAVAVPGLWMERSDCHFTPAPLSVYAIPPATQRSGSGGGFTVKEVGAGVEVVPGTPLRATVNLTANVPARVKE